MTLREINLRKFVACILFPLVFSVLGCQSAPHRETSTETALFDFHNSVWVNLHHYLYNEAFRADKASQPMNGLSENENVQVSKAVDFYRHRFKGRDLIFDEGLQKINTELSRLENSDNLEGSGISQDLRETLEFTCSIYKSHLWETQNQENLAWIAGAKAQLKKYEKAVQQQLEGVLKSKFSSEPDRVDVVHEANWAGAYTYSPPHTVISSGRPSYSGMASLEMLFHESLHAGPFEAVQKTLDEEFALHHSQDNQQLWHALLFFTAGETVRAVLQNNGVEYVPYAYKNGLFSSQRSWGKMEPLFRKYWLPYMQGHREMKQALEQIVDEYTHIKR